MLFKGNIVTGGGVLFYKYVKHDMYVLLMENRNKYEDLGGGVDSSDKNMYDTISREVNEESNQLINKNSILKRIKKSNDWFYSKKSKYIVFLIKATPDEQKLSESDFGDYEEHDGFYRKVKWIPVKQVLTSDFIRTLNFRLVGREIFTFLTKNMKK